MEGWKSGKYENRTDNANKYFGRLLYIQDLNWFLAKIFYGLLIALIYYLIKSGDLSFDGIKELIDMTK